MSDRKEWTGVAPTDMVEIANRYEAACLTAMQRARQLETDDAKFAAHFIKLREGIWAGVAQELRDLGCPEQKLASEVANVVNFAVRKRAFEGLPAKGHA
ncbi:hypothetical protein [Nitratireductor basaltis]|uniref:Uncharacterized protein n=1 Tax=Nitratireductor basaltis TaxID=472175 RepID=A0A084U7B0_9HYPH|nr:hypothetical protein [Nitratireductor basaltis]KFB08846.1 hypothetical protein EL18_03100 [Nitratireductor basaltis]